VGAGIVLEFGHVDFTQVSWRITGLKNPTPLKGGPLCKMRPDSDNIETGVVRLVVDHAPLASC
jgi:hypothetical protein